MKFVETAIPEVLLLEPKTFGDDRGFFMETYRAEWFEDKGIATQFVQDNFSRSTQGTLRGLHYQLENTQGKLVRVTEGRVFDVAVDLRETSPTFGQWVGEILSADNKRSLWVPPGFAHGFYVMSEAAEFYYKCTDYYSPQHERSLLWNDSDIGVDWPLVGGKTPLLSEKDRSGSTFKQADLFS